MRSFVFVARRVLVAVMTTLVVGAALVALSLAILFFAPRLQNSDHPRFLECHLGHTCPYVEDRTSSPLDWKG
jgi:hypothetical protein